MDENEWVNWRCTNQPQLLYGIIP